MNFLKMLAPIAAIAMTFASFSGVTQANAASISTSETSTCTTHACPTPADSLKSTKAVDDSTTERFVARATSDLSSHKVAIHAGMNNVRVSGMKVLGIDAKGASYISVTAPITGRYSMVSNITMVYSQSGKLLTWTETLFSRGNSGNFHLSAYTNNKMTRDLDLDRKYMTDAEMLQSQQSSTSGGQGVHTQGVWQTVGCLATVLGIGGPAAYLIATACAGACAAAETGVTIPICAACIGAYAVLGAGGMTAAASCFK